MAFLKKLRMKRKKILCTMAIIIVLLTSLNSFCLFSDLVNSAKQKTKKTIENVKPKNVAICAAGAALIVLNLLLLKKACDINVQTNCFLDKVNLHLDTNKVIESGWRDTMFNGYLSLSCYRNLCNEGQARVYYVIDYLNVLKYLRDLKQ